MNNSKKAKYILSFVVLNCIVAAASAASGQLYESKAPYDSYSDLQRDNEYTPLRVNNENTLIKTESCLTPSEPGCSNMWQKEKDNENRERVLDREQKKYVIIIDK